MEIDSPPESAPLRPRDRVLRRLLSYGVPEEYLEKLYPGLVDFVKDKPSLIPELVSVVLPPDEEVAEALHDAKERSKKSSSGISMKIRFRESMVWLQWLMFEDEPAGALKNLARMSVGQRGVCGAVWGLNDIAYRCRTCEHDPTCAICVPCFQNGNHKDHDYSIIYTGGGCCDCGDETAWKREGFCSNHKGAKQIQPLPKKLANSVGPVLDALLICWKNKLLCTENIGQQKPRYSDRVAECKKVANELTYVVVEMLLEFCKYSESLLSFVSRRVIASVGLSDILVRAERYLYDSVLHKLHEVLLKLLGEPIFKYEFAKVFLNYYPVAINEIVKEHNDVALKKYPILSTFSVQIFTVPTLTPRLVREMNLLFLLLGCLGDIFISCAGEDGRLQATKWGSLYDTTNRVIGDIRFVMSHAVVSKYAINEQRDISKTWMRLLAFVQGMNPLKRETGIHIEEENESMHLLFVLGHSIANIHSLLVDAAFSIASSEETDYEFLYNTDEQDMDDGESVRLAKVGRLSQESSISSSTGRSAAFACVSKVPEINSDAIFQAVIPPSVIWLIHECLRAIENWLGEDDGTAGALPNVTSTDPGSISGGNFLVLKRTLSKIGKGKSIFGRLSGSSEVHERQCSLPISSGIRVSESAVQESTKMVVGETDSVACSSAGFIEGAVERDNTAELHDLHILRLSDWPDIRYDVSSQHVSVHIPLHRLLSLLLKKALRRCYGQSAVPYMTSASPATSLSSICTDFFGHVLWGCHPCGFSAFIMEHPLRIRVFCAEVNAGMWRKNGDAALVSCEWYRSVRWSEQGLELDLFLLQCCAALAPADLYVRRILERFGLSDYLFLSLERSSEYEPILIQEMLTLIIQILQERRFCGLTTSESLRRELIYKLAIGDATRSHLVKSLPRDLSKSDQLQEMLDTVAVYSNPSGFNQGTYSLRASYWKELDLYHPRWNSRDLQVAEERYSRFCNVSALTTQLPKWTKIYPPLKGLARVSTCKVVLQIIRAVLFYAVFTDKFTESRAPDSAVITALHLLSLALDICFQLKKFNGLACQAEDLIPMLAFAGEEIGEGFDCAGSRQSLLSLLVALMRIHKKDSLQRFLEPGNYDLYSWIESLLKKFAELDSGCMMNLQKLAPEVVSHLSEPFSDRDINIQGSVSDSEKRKARARERQAAILEKMKAEQSKFLCSIGSSIDDSSESGLEASNTEMQSSEDTITVQEVCSLCHDPNSKDPVSFLILLHKSKLLSFVDRGPPSWNRVLRSDKEVSITKNKPSDLSREDFHQVNSRVGSSSQAEHATNESAYSEQHGEVNAILEFLKARFPSLKNSHAASTSNDGWGNALHEFVMLEEDMYLSIHKKMQDSMSYANLVEDVGECSVTGDDVKFATDGAHSVLLGNYIDILSREMTRNTSVSDNFLSDKMLVESVQLPVFDGFGPADCDGIHLSSCGHAVHQGCLDRYLSSLRERYVRRNVFEGAHIVDPEQGEFLCPVCRLLANSVLPATPQDLQQAWKHPVASNINPASAAGPSVTSNEEIHSLQLRQALCLLRSAAGETQQDYILKASPLLRNERTRSDLESVSCVLSRMYFPKKQNKFPGFPVVSQSIIMWDTLKYSLMSMEVASRCQRTSMAPTYGLDSLYAELQSSSGFILSLLLKVIQSTRSTNSLHVLQRFRGIQLFAESIFPESSIGYQSGTHVQEGIVVFQREMNVVCGRLCSPSWKSCCRESGCYTHAMACGAGTGVFLSIRRTTILLQRCARQSPWPSPYLDAFGEEDMEMQRGKPLYLNQERYAALTHMVAHGLDRNSKVLAQTTMGSFFII
ncbi:E3 ubiquitin-protein ligase PRT6 [Carica papaya]|uniref:E3 ubiquitin-protein ligase PRT6 n=1 Tax=Carica papaya TaxID=3649 RepID=UPI000B8CF318|nr:E3 ubiquitin-protein ligase PRT6 [Carica papaya]